MTVAFAIAVVTLLISQLIVLIYLRNLLVIIAGNQIRTHDQAHLDVTHTARTLAGADSQRQTRDIESGEDAVNTTVKSP